MQQIIIVTGMSGAGKTYALHTLEDNGYYCIDGPKQFFSARNFSGYRF